MAISAQIKPLDERKNELANKVKTFMNEAGKGESDGYKVSWTAAERRTFDTKAFAAEHKNIDLEKYYKKSTYRTFKVTEKGE
jgi:predicted phage-related endonuclease